MRTLTLVAAAVFSLTTTTPSTAAAQAPTDRAPVPAAPPVKFIDMGEMMLKGRTARPAVTFVDARQRAKFERLLELKRDVVGALRATATDAALR
jgi:hypothetical protein